METKTIIDKGPFTLKLNFPDKGKAPLKPPNLSEAKPGTPLLIDNKTFTVLGRPMEERKSGKEKSSGNEKPYLVMLQDDITALVDEAKNIKELSRKTVNYVAIVHPIGPPEIIPAGESTFPPLPAEKFAGFYQDPGQPANSAPGERLRKIRYLLQREAV